MELALNIGYNFELFHTFCGNGKEIFWRKLRQSTPDPFRKGWYKLFRALDPQLSYEKSPPLIGEGNRVKDTRIIQCYFLPKYSIKNIKTRSISN